MQIRLCESTPYPQERNVLRPSNTLVSNVLQLYVFLLGSSQVAKLLIIIWSYLLGVFFRSNDKESLKQTIRALGYSPQWTNTAAGLLIATHLLQQVRKLNHKHFSFKSCHCSQEKLVTDHEHPTFLNQS